MNSKFPKLSDEDDKRKKLTVRGMIFDLIESGFSYRELASIFDVNYTLFGKYKLTPKEARERRYKYARGSGNTPEYRQRVKEIHKDKLLEYMRNYKKQKKDISRKNIFSPRLKSRKYLDKSL